ncbi:cupin domain-containing protein [Halorussus gelatinilyticus]|uniref:Cupin domain-containing protein n=1 Tax=Halorussus gelatinilyticus TaxID=2937524 RepID=A0A8U0IH31_9EURY|nr:cupin domain-containing protein [Halorussus gelatinilyticus]UPV99378.1 cupin domain-containing protein [Halorussus gelatinilyticus]
MKNVAIADVDPTEFGDDAAVREGADRLGATDLAVNHYRIPPGEGFPSGLHAHGDQEEVFVVLDGTATFERLGPEREAADEIAVEAGEVVRFAPGEYQSGRNDGDELLVALALGAPPDSEDVRVPLDCPECGHGYLHPEAGGESEANGGSETDEEAGAADGETGETGVTLDCPACGAANVPRGCPDCGAEMRVALAGSDGAPSDPASAGTGDGTETATESETGVSARTVVVCTECGGEARSPFET